MSRSSFFSRSSSSSDRNRLLPTHTNHERGSISLQNLSPDGASDNRGASPSPPPSFYRSKNGATDSRTYPIYQSYSDAQGSTHDEAHNDPYKIGDYDSHNVSTSPERRRIQFTVPPPPIAMSVALHLRPNGKYGVDYRRAEARRNLNNQFLHLERRERAIQMELQTYLDAQSQGLVQGSDSEGLADRRSLEGSDAGSSTPTTRSVRSRSRNGLGVVPIRQPKQRKLGLRGARRGILQDISELVMLKEDQLTIISNEIGLRDDALAQLSAWEQRISDAQTVSDEAEAQGEVRELEQLREEDSAIEHDIRETEEKLMQMRAKKKWLGERIKEGINRQESRLSSWKGAVAEAEGEIRRFLKRPPVESSMVLGDGEDFLTLPPARRTLEMAKDWWEKENTQLSVKREEVEIERRALEDGAGLWQDAMAVVMGFEDELKKDMFGTNTQEKEVLNGHITKMGSAIDRLTSAVETAEENKWNLLICAIGAELEAFKEGREILRSALGLVSSEPDVKKEGPAVDNDHGINVTSGDDIVETPESGKETPARDSEVRGEESEDDGPNLAELLVESSH
jgi:hypothetical protein